MEQAMFRVLRLRPLLRQHVRGKELRSALLDEPVMVGGEHMISSPAVRTSGVRRRGRHGVMVVGSLTTGGQERRECFTQPQRPKNIHGCIAARSICFGV